MMEYVDQIEKFLRGQMSQREEMIFRASLITNPRFRLYAFIMAIMLRKYKKSW